MSEANHTLKVEELRQLSTEKLAEIVLAQQKLIEKLEKRIEQLEQSLNLDSQTSSKPPSTDLLKKSEREPEEQLEEAKQETKRKPGGQLGHRGKTRKGFRRVDRYEVLKPTTSNCGNQQWKTKAVRVETQQVAQLVPRPVEIVEYQRHHCQCAQCGAIEAAQWSLEMIPGQDLGVRLQGLLAWLGNYAHMSYAKQQELLWELGAIKMSKGTLVATNERVQQASTNSVEGLKKWINWQHPSLHCDETPWAVKGVKQWLWVLAGDRFCLFHAGDTRKRQELESVLGSSYDGILISDDFSVYNGYLVKRQQKCLAHLRRHFQRLLKTRGLCNQEIATTFLSLIDEAFEQHRVWRQTNQERHYRDWAEDFKIRVTTEIMTWLKCAGHEAGKLLRSLRDKAEQWWYFLEHPQIPPDNNLAERCLRTAVTKRKVCGGSRSIERFQQTANLLSVIQSCRLQGRSVITFFQQALQATVGHCSRSSLIPQVST